MATNLFGKYFNNPTKSYIYTDLLCNADSADEISFDINGSNGEITSNDEALAKVDLSDVHVGASQYTNDMKIIEPYSYIYVKGMIFGDTYTVKTYGRILGELTVPEDWMYNGILFFVIKYTDTKSGKPIVKSLKCAGNLSEGKTFIDVVNEYFTDEEIPIETSYDNGYVTFKATELGYDFWIDHVMFWTSENDDHIMEKINQWMVDNRKTYEYGWEDEYLDANNVQVSNAYLSQNVYSSVIKKSDYSRLYNLLKCLDTDFQTMLEESNVKKIWLFEDFSKRIAPRKYRNGAMKGLLLKATYPQFNTESIYDYQRSLKIAHLQDSVEEWYMVPESLFTGTCVATRKIIDVVDGYFSQYDSDAYNRWLGKYTHINGGDNWIDSDEVPQVVPEMFKLWKSSHTPYSMQAESIYKDMESRDAMGVEGYCAYCTKNNLWKNMGQIYCLTSIEDDDEDPYCKNLIPSFVIYNPNPFPVKINYLTFG